MGCYQHTGIEKNIGGAQILIDEGATLKSVLVSIKSGFAAGDVISTF